MAELEAGRAYVDLVPRLQAGAARAIESEFDGPFSRIGRRAGDLGRTIGIGLAGGAAAAGVALFAAAGTIDDALDSIAISTGATGAELEALETSFRRVAGVVPASFDEVSTAIGELAARTGLAGGPLEGLAIKVLDLARLTGEDLSTTIENSTRLFGDWGVAVENQNGTLDLLFRASQETGVGVNELSSTLVTFGGPLRQLGFSMEESTALIAQFGAEGVNTELVMGSMRQALGRMARAGEEPIETFRRVTGEIAAAGSAGEANALALELFGARAGPDMAAAIREGRFEIGDLVATLENSGGAIEDAAAQTDGFGETFQRLKNRVLLAIEPIATRFLTLLEDLLPRLEPIVTAIGERLPAVFERFSALAVAVAPVIEQLLGRLIELVPQIVEAVMPIVTELVAMVEERWPRIREIIEEVLVTASAVISGFIQAVTIAWDTFGQTIMTFVAGTFDAILQIIDGAMSAIRGVIDLVLGLLTGDWSRAWDGVKSILSGVWDLMQGIVDLAVERVKLIIGLALDAIALVFSNVWNGIRDALGVVWDEIRGIVESAIGGVRDALSIGMDAVSTVVSGGIDAVVGFFAALPGRLLELVGDILAAGAAMGAAILDGIAEGVSSAVGFVGDFASRIGSAVLRFINDRVLGPIRSAILTLAGALADVNIPFAGRAFDAASSLLEDVAAVFRIPGYAKGGLLSGWGIVGEDGPELMASGLSRIHSRPDLTDVLADALAASGLAPAADKVEAGDDGPDVVVYVDARGAAPGEGARFERGARTLGDRVGDKLRVQVP